jgi:hypothetical protein
VSVETHKKKCSEISIADFLFFYKKAFDRDNIGALKQLCDRYPETAKLAFDENIIDSLSPHSDSEHFYNYPIASSDDRMTEKHVLNIVAYLLGLLEVPKQYKDFLKTGVSYHQVFNYFTSRYQKDYDKDSLWDDFFMKLPELRRIIEHRHICNIDELIYHAYEYFEKLHQNEI